MKSYAYKVIFEAETDHRGPRPDDVKALVKIPGKNELNLAYVAAKAQIEKSAQAGDVTAAWKALDKYIEFRNAGGKYQFPLNVFQKDNQNGGCPFYGAHVIQGALRDSCKHLFPGKILCQKRGDGMPAKEHFRKAVQVYPRHLFFYKTIDENSPIEKYDEIADQQPAGDVGGFSRYETIHFPFQIRFKVVVNPVGIFEKTKLKDKSIFPDILNQAAIMGSGAGRGVGYGQWKVVSCDAI
jgi:hypothetical protein